MSTDAQENSTPPPPPKKPTHLRASKSGGAVSVFAAMTVAGIAVAASTTWGIWHTQYNPLLSEEDNKVTLLNRYLFSEPRLPAVSGHASAAELGRLQGYRDEVAASDLYRPDLDDVRVVPVEIERDPAREDMQGKPNSTIPAVIYRPTPQILAQKLSLGEELPTLVYFHGGLFASGSANDSWAVNLARDTPCMVISVEYPLAPEERYPRAVLDGVDAVYWAMDNAEQLSAHVDKFGLAGLEAGATVAASVAYKLRDRGFKHAVNLLALAHPVLSRPSNKMVSYAAHEAAWMDHDIAWDMYTNSTSKEDKKRCRHDPYCSPFHQKNFENLPPLLVYTASHSPTRSAGTMFFDKVYQAGEFTKHVEANATHVGAVNRLDQDDAGWELFVEGVHQAFWPPESELEKAIRTAKEYALHYG